jgi:hypothetical protein
MQVSKVMKLAINLQKIHRDQRRKRSSQLKKIDVHLLAIYGDVLQMPIGSVQMNGLSVTVVAENTIASMTTINRIG